MFQSKRTSSESPSFRTSVCPAGATDARRRMPEAIASMRFRGLRWLARRNARLVDEKRQHESPFLDGAETSGVAAVSRAHVGAEQQKVLIGLVAPQFRDPFRR